jgi:hypothetical protein
MQNVPKMQCFPVIKLRGILQNVLELISEFRKGIKRKNSGINMEVNLACEMIDRFKAYKLARLVIRFTRI